MNKKAKGFLSVFVMSLMSFMIIDTRYARPLGDYIVEFIGLRSWTGDQTGLHLSVIYFGFLFIVSILFVRRFAMSELNLNWKRIFVSLIGLNILFTFVTGTIVKSIKENSEGLLAIGIEKQSNLSYEFDGETYIQFDGEITLKNYSDEEQYFYLMIDDREGIGSAQLYNWYERDSFFSLKGNEEKTFFITVDNVKVENIDFPDYDWASGTGGIDRLVLTNEDGEAVRLEKNDFLGETIK